MSGKVGITKDNLSSSESKMNKIHHNCHLSSKSCKINFNTELYKKTVVQFIDQHLKDVTKHFNNAQHNVSHTPVKRRWTEYGQIFALTIY